MHAVHTYSYDNGQQVHEREERNTQNESVHRVGDAETEDHRENRSGGHNRRASIYPDTECDEGKASEQQARVGHQQSIEQCAL